MINFRKAGLLILTLVIPALVFVFLKLFATNHYDLPYYHPQQSGSGQIEMKGRDTVFYQVPDIRLKKTDGQPFTEKFGNGKLVVVASLPVHCKDSCKIVLGQIARIFALRENIPNLSLLTIAENWQGKSSDFPDEMDSTGWNVLTGSTGEVNHVLNQVLKMGTSVPKAKSNLMDSKVVLIDTKGKVRGYYNFSDPEETDRLMGEIKILDYEKN